MKQFNYFYNNQQKKSTEILSLDDLLLFIKDGRWSDEIAQVRAAVREFGRGSDEHNDAKKNLPAIILSAEVHTRSSTDELGEKLTLQEADERRFKSYSFILQDDTDHYEGDLNRLKDQFSKDPYRIFTAISPSGDGLKSAISFSVPDSIQIDHKNVRDYHKRIALYFDKIKRATHNLGNDPAVKDPFRLCYILYDPEIHINENVEPLEIPLEVFQEIEPKAPEKEAKTTEKAVDSEKGLRELSVVFDKIKNAPIGERHNTILHCSRLLGGLIGRISIDEAREHLISAVRSNPTIDDDSFIQTIEDGLNDGQKATLLFRNFTEQEVYLLAEGGKDSDAKLFFQLSNKTVRCAAKSAGKDFYVYEEGLWHLEDECSERVSGAVYKTLKTFYEEALDHFQKSCSDKDFLSKMKKALLKKIKLLGESSYILGIIFYIRRENQLNTDLLDKDGKLIHFLDGVLDLRTGLLREHRQEDYLTRSTKKAYPTHKECPNFKAFTKLCFSENNFSDEENKELLYDLTFVMASMLDGTLTNKCYFFDGSGNNGKSQWLRQMGKALGDYFTSVGSEKILNEGREQSIIMSSFRDVRSVVLTDLKNNVSIDSLKNFVSDGERDCFRDNYKGYVYLDKHYVTIVANNHRIRVSDDGASMKDRFIFFPWHHRFEQEGRDKVHFYENLYNEEAEGILGWILDCCLYWSKRVVDGHKWSETLKKFNDDQFGIQTERNSLEEFIAEQYQVKSGFFTIISDFYADYSNWLCDEKPVDKKSIKKFLPKEVKTSQKKVEGRNTKVYLGLKKR